MATKSLTPEISAVLQRATIDGNRLVVPNNPDGSRLDRKLYMDVDAVLSNLGGKWNTKAKAHIFDGPVKERLAEVFATGKSVDVKTENQAFYTPADLATRVVAHVGVKGFQVLEPSAGCGNLAKACMSAGAVGVTCFELDEKSGKQLLDAGFADTTIGDFLESKPHRKFDRIVMNPPFRRNTYIKHIVHAMKWLSGTGKLVSIIPGGVNNPKLIKELGNRNFEIKELPDDSFKESGTCVNTSVLILQ
jgi:hypothetical protein